jgi:hypothetical protein
MLVILLICCFGSTKYILSQCFWWECAPKRGFTATDLSLPDHLFPSGAVINSPGHLTDDYASVDDMIQGASWQDGAGLFTYIVRRYATTNGAVKGFNFDRSWLSEEPWLPSGDLNITSAFADETFSACGNWAGYRCEYIARYQEYVVSINSIIDMHMSYDKFEAIAEYIDKQISSRLYP